MQGNGSICLQAKCMNDAFHVNIEFENLGFDFSITSPQTKAYNCIAWAAGETHRFWWPDEMKTKYWPKSVTRKPTIEAFIEAFATLGYSVCDNEAPENGFEKIAIFAKPFGTPTHAARELGNGRWTSKLGNEHDIEHALRGLEGDRYGKVKIFMKRPLAER